MAVYTEYQEYVRAASQKYGVDERLIWAVMEQESGGNKTAVSNAGAQGLMQLMPSTSKEMGVTNPFDPEQNIDGGTKLLSQLLNQWNGDTEAALASYYAGAGNVRKYGKEKYSKYYKNVLSKMDGVNVEQTGNTPVQQTEFFDGSLKWWGDIVSVVLWLLCVLLGIVFIYFAINGGMPSTKDILKLVG